VHSAAVGRSRGARGADQTTVSAPTAGSKRPGTSCRCPRPRSAEPDGAFLRVSVRNTSDDTLRLDALHVLHLDPARRRLLTWARRPPISVSISMAGNRGRVCCRHVTDGVHFDPSGPDDQIMHVLTRAGPPKTLVSAWATVLSPRLSLSPLSPLPSPPPRLRFRGRPVVGDQAPSSEQIGQSATATRSEPGCDCLRRRLPWCRRDL